MHIGYNTNGFGFHALEDALAVIADAGYSCVAITPDVHHLNPFTTTPQEAKRIGMLARRLGLAVVLETGARFVLDPRAKHRPTLLDDDPWLRLLFMRRCFDLAEDLGATIIGAWSGARPEHHPDHDDELYLRLAHHWQALSHQATSRGLTLAIEPEPGFLIDSMGAYRRLCQLMGTVLPLTIDIGHVICVGDGGEGPIGEAPARVIRTHRDSIVNIQLDDMRPGDHTHLMFGHGVVDLAQTFAALREINFTGPACVELSDGSRNAVTVCRDAMAAIRRAQSR